MTQMAESVQSRNQVGTISLVVSLCGFCALEIAQAGWGLSSPFWVLVRRGFEAAVIGGVADWFAVRALFYPIPSKPLRALPHTDLLIANRVKLTDGLVDLVENQLLSPTSVQERLKEFSASRLIIAQLESSEGRSNAIDALLSLAGRFAGELQDTKLRAFLTDLLREQLRDAEIAPLVGEWLLSRIEHGDTRMLWTTVGGALAAQADAGAFDALLEDAVTAILDNLRDESWFKGKVVSWIVNPKHDALWIGNAIGKVLKEQSTNPSHPLNEKLDEAVRNFARRLMACDPEATAQIRKLQAGLAAHADFEKLVGHIMTDVRAVMQTHLSSRSPELDRALDGLLVRTSVKLKNDGEAQEKLNVWVRGVLQDLATQNHSVIGATARQSINDLPDDVLVAQLETKIGHDLQFIRLNGALVGGMVGVLIAALRMLVP